MIREKRIKLLVLLAFLLSLFNIIILPLDNKLKIIIIVFCLIVVAFFNNREDLGQELVVAFLFSAIITSYYHYVYVGNNFFFGRINLYPLVLWTGGLALLREIYESLRVKNKLLLSFVIYWFLLLSLEYLFYLFVGVQLDWDYSGLLGLNIIHGPLGMKVFYLLAGPAYLLITDYLKVK